MKGIVLGILAAFCLYQPAFAQAPRLGASDLLTSLGLILACAVLSCLTGVRRILWCFAEVSRKQNNSKIARLLRPASSDLRHPKRVYTGARKRSHRFAAVAIVSFLTGCGGGSSGSTSGNFSDEAVVQDTVTSDVDNELSMRAWEGLQDSGLGPIGIATGIERRGEDVYLSFNALSGRNLFRTQDGASFHSYYTGSTSAIVAFVDDLGRIYTSSEYADGDELFLSWPSNSEISLVPFVEGDSSVLISDYSLGNATQVKRSLDRGNSWETIDLDTGTDYGWGRDPAFNGGSAFLVVSKSSGIWRTEDSGASWTNMLGDIGRFDAVAGNANFPTLFYAIKRRALSVSTDTGTTWQVYEPPADPQKGEIVEWIDLELLDDGELVAWGVPLDADGGTGQVFRSDNSGQSWLPIGTPIGYGRNAIVVGLSDLEANSQYYFVKSGGAFYRLPRR